MQDIKIKISKSDRKVYLEETSKKIGNDAENLQGKFIFTFTDEYVEGTGRIEYILPNSSEKYYQMLTKNTEEKTYEIPIKSVITKEGKVYMQVVVTESGTEEEEIPIFKSNVFYVYVDESINAEAEEPEEYASWIEVANSKISEIDKAIQGVENLNIEASKTDSTTTITITDKEGETSTTKILDGVGLEYNWNDTSLGVKRENEEEYTYTDLKGESGEANFVLFGIESGNLYMYKPEELTTDISFEVDSDGYLLEIMSI